MNTYEFLITYNDGTTETIYVPGATRVCAELWLHTSPADFGADPSEIEYIDYVGITEDGK